ncbi:MAG: DUF362 domain-containing protein [Desulfohalobiaceae bacterium]
MTDPVHLSVHLIEQPDYAQNALDRTVGGLLQAVTEGLGNGLRVLVKPNLITATNAGISCTHPGVVLAVCGFFLARGDSVQVGDSPAFGSARYVAGRSGLSRALSRLPVTLVGFDRGRRVVLSGGQSAAIAVQALECDLLVNVPKLKAHAQMRVSGCVKNLFGCVVGLRKALAHARLGNDPGRFSRLILDIGDHLPHTLHLVDGVQAMHTTGPVHGRRLDFGLLGAAADSIALDTALYTLLGLTPEQVPLWREALRQERPGAFASTLEFPVLEPGHFAGRGFELPTNLTPISFHPLQLLQSALRRLTLTTMNKLAGR